MTRSRGNGPNLMGRGSGRSSRTGTSTTTTSGTTTGSTTLRSTRSTGRSGATTRESRDKSRGTITTRAIRDNRRTITEAPATTQSRGRFRITKTVTINSNSIHTINNSLHIVILHHNTTNIPTNSTITTVHLLPTFGGHINAPNLLLLLHLTDHKST